MEIENKRILVTGASRGLGWTLAFALAEAGASEVLAGTRTAVARDRILEKASEAKLNVKPVQLDVTLDDDVRAVAQAGTIDILVNNAGVAGYGNPLTMKFEDVETELAVNYLGALRMARAVAPAMIAQHNGLIVNVATAFAKINLPLIGTYCATKAALLSLGQALRAHLADHGVRVITVLPTTIDTDMSRGADVPKMTKEFVAREILAAIREEKHDPPIGDEARGVLEQLQQDPVGLERSLMMYK